MSLIKRLCTEQNILYLLYATLFLIPLSPVVLYTSLIPAILLACGDSQRWNCGKLQKIGGGFILCSLLSVTVSKDVCFSFFNWCFEPFMYMALYILMCTYMRSDSEKKKAIQVLFWGAVVVVLWGILQYTDIVGMARDLSTQAWVDPERFPLLRRRMFSTLENPNLFGAYLLMVISLFVPLFLKEGKNAKSIFHLLFIVILLLCLALTYSRGAWVSVLIIMGMLTIFYDKRFGVLFLILPVILCFYHGQMTERFISLFYGEDTSLGLRMALWESTWAMIEEHPLLGVGWGGYWVAYPEYNFFIQDTNVIIYHAHNMYLHLLATVGVPGGLCYLTFFWGHAYFSWKSWKEKRGLPQILGLSGLLLVVAIGVNGLADFVLFSRSISFYCIALLALCTSDASSELEKEEFNTRNKNYC